jgi:hypothetical protein
MVPGSVDRKKERKKEKKKMRAASNVLIFSEKFIYALIE